MNAQLDLSASAKAMNTFSQPCQILVLSEDVLTYGRAMYVCQRVLGQFAQQMDFNFHCWNFRQETDEDTLQESLQKAARADIIILSLASPELSRTLSEWLQAFGESRSQTQGALALVLGPSAHPLLEIQKFADQIEALSEQVGMDFVPLMPENSTGVFPPPRNSREYWQTPERTYDHWGLNE